VQKKEDFLKKNAGYPSVDSWVLHARDHFQTLEALQEKSKDYLKAVINLQKDHPPKVICDIYPSVTEDMVTFTRKWITLLSTIAQWGYTAPAASSMPAPPVVATVPLRLMLLFQNMTEYDFPLTTKEHPHIWLRATEPGDHLQEFIIATWIKCEYTSSSLVPSPDLCTECPNTECHYSARYQPAPQSSISQVLGFAYRPYLAIPSIDAPDFYSENGEYCIPQEFIARQRLHALLTLYHAKTQAEFSASNLLFALQSVISDHLNGNTSTAPGYTITTFVQRLSGLGAAVYPKTSLPKSGLKYVDPYEIWQLN